MKKTVLIFALQFLAITIQAQQINTSGGSTLENDFSAEWIIGGFLIDNSIFTEAEIDGSFLNESRGIEQIEVNPTVTIDFLTISRKNVSEIRLSYKITNASGVNILNGEFNMNNPFELDVNRLAAGNYVITFNSTDDKSFLVSKKFIKL